MSSIEILYLYYIPDQYSAHMYQKTKTSGQHWNLADTNMHYRLIVSVN